MYEAFYRLNGKPFQLNPDPSFYFGSRQHRRATAYLEYGLHQNEGFIVVTGEVGAGKTTIVRNLFAKLDSGKLVAANLVSTQLDADDILRMVAAAFGVPTRGSDKASLILAIEGFLVSTAARGKRCLLVVDEAQNLSPRALEELRMLSNFQLRTSGLLQSFLIGQPEFRATLQSPHMRQLRQRVIAACHIGPLDEEETRAYIEHRLRCVGWKDSPSFDPDAFKAIHEASGGVPRRINTVCDRLLLRGLLSEKSAFAREDVAEVAEEFDFETQGARASGRTLDGDPDVPAESELLSKLSQEDTAARLVQLEGSLLRLERNLLRLERSNSASLSLLGKLVNRLRSGPASGDGSP